ncbi:unnamed protein product [Hermetia illucens]|uniref:Uncharacterized protein n=1 Tax=Hermetia illucens TaxID=343691 RepID=A0A7R8UU39_HERIL|nr:unnamed protein product [Hermetia illucens]
MRIQLYENSTESGVANPPLKGAIWRVPILMGYIWTNRWAPSIDLKRRAPPLKPRPPGFKLPNPVSSNIY